MALGRPPPALRMTSVATPSTHRPAAAGGRRSSSAGRRASPGCCCCPSLAVVAFVAIYPLGKTVYQSFTDQEFLALEPTKLGGPRELPRALARHGLPELRLEDGQVHADHRRLRVRARAGHRPRRQLELQGARRHACGHARSVGDPDRGRGADVEVDARRHVRRRERRRRRGCTSCRTRTRGSPTRAPPWPRSARSTSGRRRRSSPCSCSPASR